MKALSGRQPWWWAILHAGKRIENRSWHTAYRGPILLHAAKGCTKHEFRDAFGWMRKVFGADWIMQHGPPRFENMVRGGIVGRARIVDVIRPATGGLFGPCNCARRVDGIDGRWHMHEQFGFVLTDVEPLPFVPCKGALSLFELDYP